MVECGVPTDPLVPADAPITPDPRVARTRSTVLAAAGEVLVERGYEGFTVEAVVGRTGVAKTTIYRHWPTRTDLLHAVLSTTKPDTVISETGDLRADLVGILCGVAGAAGRDVYLRSMPSLVAAAQRDPELGDLHSRLADARSAGLRDLLDRARDRRALRPDCDVELLAHTLIGLVFVRRIFRDLPTGEPEITSVVDMVLRGAAPSAADSASLPK